MPNRQCSGLYNISFIKDYLSDTAFCFSMYPSFTESEAFCQSVPIFLIFSCADIVLGSFALNKRIKFNH